MKKLFYLICLFPLFAACEQHDVKLWLTDPLEPIYPDTNKFENYTQNYTLDFPLGTVADVHMVFNAPINSEFKVQATVNDKPVDITNFNLLTDVPVEQNTGVDSRTEMYLNQINPDVIRRAPFRVYEALSTMKSETVTAKNTYTALRLAVPANQLKLGENSIVISAKGKGWRAKGTFTAVVHNVQLPDLANGKFFFTNWFSLKQMEEKHELERWSDKWFAVLDKYAALMAHARQNGIIIPGELIRLENDKILLDEERMYRFIEVFKKYGFQYFESPHLMNRGDNDDWGDPELKVALTKRGYHTPEGKKDIETLTTLIKAFTTKYNLTYNWLQHISDEPTSVQAKCYQQVVKQVKGIYPEIKILEATNDRDGLVGAVDMWCPLINDFQENIDFFEARAKAGERVYVYTCLIPGGKWLNRLIDQERLRQVYFGWGAIRYNTSGYLHWGLNYYMGNPYEYSVVHHFAPGAGDNNFLPAGDTHVIYPEAEGPVSSTRFEAHRIGIEDYEMLHRLQQLNPNEANQIVSQCFTSYTDYVTQVSNYRAARKMLLLSLANK